MSSAKGPHGRGVGTGRGGGVPDPRSPIGGEDFKAAMETGLPVRFSV